MVKKILGLTFFVVLSLLAGCSSDELVEEPTVITNGLRTVQITSLATVSGEGGSRVSIVDRYPTWEASDTIIVKADNTDATNPITFSRLSTDILSIASDKKSATFRGEIILHETINPDSLHAYFPKTIDGTFDLTRQAGDARKAVMFGKSAYTLGAQPSFSFKNMSTVLNISMNLPAGVSASNVKRLIVSGANSKGAINVNAFPAVWDNSAMIVDDIIVEAALGQTDGLRTSLDGTKVLASVAILPGTPINDLVIYLVAGEGSNEEYYRWAPTVNSVSNLAQNKV